MPNKKNDKTGQPLTDREDQVLWLMAEGLSNKLIAARLDISEHTAKFHVYNACCKMGTTNRTKAAVNFVLGQPGVAQQRLLGKHQQLQLVA